MQPASLLRYGPEDPGFESNPVLLFETSTTDSYSMIIGIFSPTVKKTGTEFEHSSLSSDEIIKPLASNTWPLCLHGLDRDNLTFTIYILAYTRSHRVLGSSVFSGSIFGIGSEQFHGVSLCGAIV